MTQIKIVDEVVADSENVAFKNKDIYLDGEIFEIIVMDKKEIHIRTREVGDVTQLKWYKFKLKKGRHILVDPDAKKIED